MATSELEHYVRFDPSVIGGDDFADAGMCRRAVGNLDHLADQAAQVRVNWTHPLSGGYSAIYEQSPETNTYYELWRTPSFDMHVRGDGTSYPMRVRLTAAVSNAAVTGSLRVVLAPAGHEMAELHAGGANVSSVMTTASTSHVELEPSDLIYLDAARVQVARESVSCIDAVGGAERSGVRLAVRFVVFASVNNDAAHEARLRGAYGAEYIPPP